MNAEDAYAACAEITRTEARNFSYGIRLLPARQRRAMCAVYAFARRIDDIGDGDAPGPRKTEQLAACRADLHRLLDDEVADEDDPVLVAMQDAAHRLPIPLAAFDELIDGCQADVDGRRYETFDDLVHYCRCVAGSVGRLSLGIYDPPRAEQIGGLADSLGVALQLTNILRDVREDRRNGRVYLPQEDMERFGCTLDLDDAGELADPPERFDVLIRFEARRAGDWYARGLRLLPLLDHRSAACTAAMAGIYRRLLRHIAADPEAIRHTRLSLSTAGKLRVAARALAWGRA